MKRGGGERPSTEGTLIQGLNPKMTHSIYQRGAKEKNGERERAPRGRNKSGEWNLVFNELVDYLGA